jgi:EAL domain-containing protein (putative c-di-GMP-specific phosphodiesterase class I)/ActR/RegA family two-component response regulator
MTIKNALVADSNAVQRDYLVRLLQRLGVPHVMDAPDGAQAIDAVHKMKWDLVVAALDMPGATGLQVVDALAATRSNARLILNSAHDQRMRQAAHAYAQSQGVRLVAVDALPGSGNPLLALAVLLSAEQAAPDARMTTEPFAPTAMDIEHAFASDQFVACFEPQHHIATGALYGAELLPRWRHPQRGVIGPAHFLPAVAAAGLEQALCEYMICHAMAMLGELGSNHALRLGVSVPAAIARSAIWGNCIAQLATQANVRTSNIGIGINHHEPARYDARLAGAVAQLRLLGFDCTIDGGANGFAAPNRLSLAPFNTLTIDRELVSRAGTSTQGKVLLASTIAKARNLDMTVIAQGIDTENDLAHVRALECDVAQGHYYGRPMAGHAFIAHVARTERVVRRASRSMHEPAMSGT